MYLSLYDFNELCTIAIVKQENRHAKCLYCSIHVAGGGGCAEIGLRNLATLQYATLFFANYSCALIRYTTLQYDTLCYAKLRYWL